MLISPVADTAVKLRLRPAGSANLDLHASSKGDIHALRTDSSQWSLLSSKTLSNPSNEPFARDGRPSLLNCQNIHPMLELV